MVQRFLHDPRFRLRQRLRPWMPVYDAVMRRKKNLDRMPTPVECLRALDGRGVFLLSFGRCGTTVFSDFLASHPGVATFGEVLNENTYYSFFSDFSRRTLSWRSLRPSHMEREFYAYVARLVRRMPERTCLFDMKITSLHLIEGNWRFPEVGYKFYRHLRASGAPVILIERKDLVARHVSSAVAAARQAYHSYHDAETSAVTPVEIDIPEMERRNAVVRAALDDVKARFADHSRFTTVVYEEMFEADPETGTKVFSSQLAARMAAFLELPDQFERRPQLEQVSDGAYHDLLADPAAVEAARARQTA